MCGDRTSPSLASFLIGIVIVRSGGDNILYPRKKKGTFSHQCCLAGEECIMASSLFVCMVRMGGSRFFAKAQYWLFYQTI